mmetsp:Transcript_13883/g.29709  ORF Transcript_13883/g.29709 Transcript_13883/m.29709 type:complete len:104 (-) Transcript_13883:747-1058(-)
MCLEGKVLRPDLLILATEAAAGTAGASATAAGVLTEAVAAVEEKLEIAAAAEVMSCDPQVILGEQEPDHFDGVVVFVCLNDCYCCSDDRARLEKREQAYLPYF